MSRHQRACQTDLVAQDRLKRRSLARVLSLAIASVSLLGFEAVALEINEDGTPPGEWYEEAILLHADGAIIDTASDTPSRSGVWFEEDRNGHAGPTFHDYDQDGLEDLVIGGSAGRFRLYLNQGEPGAPVFSDYEWIEAAGETAIVRNWCCVAAGPSFADIDGDGHADLTAGSYSPGLIYWFQGQDGGFRARQSLTDWGGLDVITRLNEVDEGPHLAYAAKPAWLDWDDDGRLDLIIGNAQGDLVVRRNHGPAHQPGITPVEGQPVFATFSWGGSHQLDVFEVVEGGAGPMQDEEYLVPAVGDWDGDGHPDLIVGTQSGAVYFLRNLGGEEIAFAAPERLLPSVRGGEHIPAHVVRPGQYSPVRGSRASVALTDYNGDGVLDLVVGDWSRSLTLKSGLSDAELEAFEALQDELVALDRRAGVEGPDEPFRDRFRSTFVYFDNEDLREEMQALEQRLGQFLEPVDSTRLQMLRGYERQHGHVWVYVR